MSAAKNKAARGNTVFLLAGEMNAPADDASFLSDNYISRERM
jgi:hypothetical protein